MPAGEPPPLGRAGCLQSATHTHTLAELKTMCTHHHISNLSYIIVHEQIIYPFTVYLQ